MSSRISKARVYKKEPAATQSGRNNLGYWVLEPIVDIQNSTDRLMGWNGGGDIRQQIKLKFSTLNEAEIYAEENGIMLEYIKINERNFKLKSYAENFTRKK